MPNVTVPNISLSAEWGPDDPEVESIWILFKDVIRKIEDDNIQDEADFWADRIYEKLNEARNHYKQITKVDFQTRPTSEQSTEYNALYSALWSAYKDRLVKLAAAIGYDIKPMFSGASQYDSQITSFVGRYPELAQLKNYVDIQKRNWQDALRDNRNAHEHDGDLRGMLDLPNFNTKEDAKKLFILTARAIETIGVTLLSYKLPDYWNVIILNNRSTVFDRMPRYELRHAMMGTGS